MATQCLPPRQKVVGFEQTLSKKHYSRDGAFTEVAWKGKGALGPDCLVGNLGSSPHYSGHTPSFFISTMESECVSPGIIVAEIIKIIHVRCLV